MAVSFEGKRVGEDTALAPSRSFRAMLWLAGVLVSLWLLSPAFTSTDLECFTERLQSLALSGLRGDVGRDDWMYPVFSEYLYTTRVGLVSALAWMMRLTGSASPWNFRAMILGSLVVLCWASVVFVRRWTRQRIGLGALLLALMLLPGLIEASFYFADNLPSAALLAVAMAMVTPRMGAGRWLGIGVLFAAATLVRMDAIYALPFFAGLFLMTDAITSTAGRLRSTVSAAIAFVVGAGAIFIFCQWSTGVSLRTSLAVGEAFRAFHATLATKHVTSLVALGFFGLISPGLIAVGARQNWSTNDRRWRWVFVALPVAYYLFVIPQALQTRDFLLIGVPFLVLHMAMGLQHWGRMLEDHRSRQRLVGWGLVAGAVLLTVAPALIVMEDGPRTPLGRLWSPILFRQWQRGRDAATDGVESVLHATTGGAPTYVLSATWQPDSAFHLALLRHGWTFDPPAPERGVCGQIEEVYRQGTRTLVQFRAENPYELATRGLLHLDWDFVQAYQTRLALQCITEQHLTRGYLALEEWAHFLEATTVVTGSGQPSVVLIGAHVPVLKQKGLREPAFQLIELHEPELRSLAVEADRVLSVGQAAGERIPATYSELHEAFRSHWWRPDL